MNRRFLILAVTVFFMMVNFNSAAFSYGGIHLDSEEYLDAINKIIQKKDFFRSNEEYNNILSLVELELSDSPEKSNRTLFSLINNDIDFHTLSNAFKFLEISPELLINVTRNQLAGYLESESDQGVAEGVARFFGHWTPTLDEVWTKKVFNNGESDNKKSLADLIQPRHELLADVYEQCDRVFNETLHQQACKSKVIMLSKESENELIAKQKDVLLESLQDLVKEGSIPYCKPTESIYDFLNKIGVYLKSDQITPKHNAVINFIWVGPQMPKKYVDNLLHWKKAFPHDDIVLWHVPEFLNEREKVAMEALSDHTGITLKSLSEFRSKVPYLENTFNRILSLESSDPESIATQKIHAYVNISDTMRFLLPYLIADQLTKTSKSYVYLDLDIEFQVSCGFSPAKTWPGDILVHSIDNETSWADDVFAVRPGVFPGDELRPEVDEILEMGGLLTTRNLFSHYIRERKQATAFPFYWNIGFHDGSYEALDREDLFSSWTDHYWLNLNGQDQEL